MSRGAAASRHKTPWGLQRELIDFLESGWRNPDNGIWEVRGPRRHFTHSKVMAWVALDRMVRAVQRYGLDGPADRWQALRDAVHEEICAKAFDADENAFVQSFGGRSLDAATLMLPLVGFLPANDPRCVGTAKAIESKLMRDGFLLRYTPDEELEGLHGREGAFLACTFWLADNYAMRGETDKAQEIFGRLSGVANDVGLLSEEYDPVARRQLGNFPQAFSHVSLVNTAHNLAKGRPAEKRAQ